MSIWYLFYWLTHLILINKGVFHVDFFFIFVKILHLHLFCTSCCILWRWWRPEQKNKRDFSKGLFDLENYDSQCHHCCYYWCCWWRIMTCLMMPVVVVLISILFGFSTYAWMIWVFTLIRGLLLSYQLLPTIIYIVQSTSYIVQGS